MRPGGASTKMGHLERSDSAPGDSSQSASGILNDFGVLSNDASSLNQHHIFQQLQFLIPKLALSEIKMSPKVRERYTEKMS